MANPQKENGYTAIANEILDALAGIRISGEARQILDVIFRKTYGYNKKDDCIALSQFCLSTKMKKPNVCRAIQKLYDMNIIIKKDNEVANVYRINKDFDTWKPLSKKITLSKKIITIINNDKNRYQKRYIQKTKDNITKDIPLSGGIEDPPKFSKEGAEIIKSFEIINPACKNYYNRPPQRQACEDLIKSYTLEKVKMVIERTLPKTNGKEFFPTITTPLQLREKWSSLESAIFKHQGKIINSKPKVIFSPSKT